MMKKIYSIIAMAILLVGISSCQKDKFDVSGKIQVPEETDVTQLERWSYEIPLTIESNSEWKIEIDGEFCYTDITEGTGNATVLLCITDNATDEKQKGSLTVVFPQDPSKNYTLHLQQKCSADYGDNADNITVGNRIYAIGYGYDMGGEYASPNSVQLPQIIEFAKAQKDGLIKLGPVTASFEAKTYSGSSVSELSNQLNVEASFSGGIAGFSGEIGATFDMKSFSNNSNEYAISYVEVVLKDAVIETDIVTLREKYLTDAASRAINGINKSGAPSVTYPSTDAGFKELLKQYGTHLIVKSRLGGRMKYSMVTDISKIEGAYDLNAYANANYKNAFVKASASVSDTYKQSFKKNSSACNTRLQIVGGDTKTALNLSNADNDQNVEAWKNSLLNGQNLALVGLDLQKGLIPLYELVDAEEYPERAAALKAYMTSDKIKDVIKSAEMVYDCGNTAKVDVPTFDSKGSLVKIVSAGGQQVAQICEEFIPVIDMSKRVTVIYPIIANKVKLNMGYFIGDQTHRPARICWEGANLTVTEEAKESIGSKKTVYLRGSSFSTSKPKDNVVPTTTTEEYLSAYYHDGSLYKYPIVKIFNNYWLKKNYNASKRLDGTNHDDRPWYHNVQESFYGYTCIPDAALEKSGWVVPSSNDYRELMGVLQKLQNFEMGPAFCIGGVLGFDAPLTGYKDAPGKTEPEKNTQSEYWTSDRDHFTVNRNYVNVASIHYDWGYWYSIRFIKK